jgi:hypothetical protein
MKMDNIMNGVTVVNQVTKSTGEGIHLFFGISIGILSIYLIYLIFHVKEYEPICGLVIACILSVVFSVYCFHKFVTRTEYIEYKVTIDDTVKYNEFTNKFYVYSQEGKLYTVTLKDKEND